MSIPNTSKWQSQPEEHAGYFEVGGLHLYTVLHEAVEPVARVLLVGPFASERHNSYLAWARWARYLATRHVEVLRYDYRGIGESTGAFASMTFADWMEDVEQLSQWLRERDGEQSRKLPLILHGLETGAVLAGQAFQAGNGDALMLWSPPATANDALRATLLRFVGFQQFFKAAADRKPATSYIEQLEQQGFLEVDGYRWTLRLWQESFEVALPSALLSADENSFAYGRPVRNVKLGRGAAPFVRGGAVGFHESKDFAQLFASHFEWVSSVSVKAGAQPV